MANYYATARTNYFKVKDPENFRKELEALDIEHIDQDDDVFMFYCTYNGFPVWAFPDGPDEEEIEIEWAELFATYLVPGEVAVMMEAGSEKARYVTGFAEAFDHTGACVHVNLDQIYEKAAKAFGVARTTISNASY